MRQEKTHRKVFLLSTFCLPSSLIPPIVERRGVEPRSPVCKTGAQSTRTTRPIFPQLIQWNHGERHPDFPQQSGCLPLGRRPHFSDRGGSRTHTTQALNLPALPIGLPGRRVAEPGTRTQKPGI
jgi:hypothetical protein